MTRPTFLALATLMMCCSASVSQADVFNVLDVRARHLKGKTKLLATGVDQQLKQSSTYERMLDNLRLMSRLSDEVSRVAKNQRDLSLLQTYMTQLEYSFDHFESEFQRAHEDAAKNFGLVRGSTRHMKTTMSEVEDEVDAMKLLVTRLRQVELERQRRAAAAMNPVYVYPATHPAYGPNFGQVYGPNFGVVQQTVYRPAVVPGTVVYRNGVRYTYDRFGRLQLAPVRGDRSGLQFGNGRFNVRFRF